MPAQSQYDLVIEGGRIVDGTGAAWFHGDLGIRDGRIAAHRPAGPAQQAPPPGSGWTPAGLVVAPGFIDIQSHSRAPSSTATAAFVSKITQGITTEIMGEGWTNAPANDRPWPRKRQTDRAPRATSPALRGFDQWLLAMEQHGTSPNVGSFLGAADGARLRQRA